MKILILGGTGAMGAYLAPLFACAGNEVFVTSRSARKSDKENLSYSQGDAHEMPFLREILRSPYDVIVGLITVR